MHITLVAVSSLDGKITKGDNPKVESWTSEEDKRHFGSLIKGSSLIIMGRKTFEAAKEYISLTPNTLRVVMTRDKERYKKWEVKGQLEFTDKGPETLLKDLEERKFTSALLVGGGEINSEFLKKSLVNSIFLTLEPIAFGSGKNVAGRDGLDVPLKLESVEKLNEKGTLLLKYKVKML